MSDKSKIEWCDATWNPVVGCSKIGVGCANCYAIRQVHRLGENPNLRGAYSDLVEDGNWTGLVTDFMERLDQPSRWKRPRRIFVASMSDLFHRNALKFFPRILGAIRANPHHRFIISTHRYQAMKESLERESPIPHLILLASCSNQTELDNAAWPLIDLGLRGWNTGYSLEPLLGPIDLEMVRARFDEPVHYVDILRGGYWSKPGAIYSGTSRRPGEIKGGFVNHSDIKDGLPKWIIVGGESGPRARPMSPAWVRTIRDQCIETQTPLFFKQWGENIGAIKETFDEVWAGQDNETYPDDGTVRRFSNTGDIYEYGYIRVGKRSAGRRLYDAEFSQYPECMRLS